MEGEGEIDIRVLDESKVICLGTCSCVEMTPPWWKTPISVPRRMLKISQEVQNHFRPRVEVGRRMHVSSSGTQGRRNRGS